MKSKKSILSGVGIILVLVAALALSLSGIFKKVQPKTFSPPEHVAEILDNGLGTDAVAPEDQSLPSGSSSSTGTDGQNQQHEVPWPLIIGVAVIFLAALFWPD